MLWKDNLCHFLRDGVDEVKLKRINIIDLKSWLETETNVKEMAFGNSCETERIKRKQIGRTKVFKNMGKTICKGDAKCVAFKHVRSQKKKKNVFDALLSQKRNYRE